MRQKEKNSQKKQEKILALLAADDDERLEEILMENGRYNPILFEIPNTPKPLRKSPNLVCAAAYYGALKVLRFLFQANINPIITDSRGRSIAHYAVYSGKVETLEFLSGMGLSLDVSSNNLKTPIHIAAKHGHIDLCQYLWASGVDLKQYDKKGMQPIHCALINGQFKTVEFLEIAGCSLEDKMMNKSNLYITAIRRNRFDALSYLIQRGIPQTQCEAGNFPLHEAVKARLDDVVEILLANGGDPCCVNKKLETPLHIAAKKGDTTIVMKILDAVFTNNQFVDLFDIEKKTPLHYAAKFGHIEVINLLVDFGADIFSTDKNGCTAMNIAYSRKHFAAVDVFRSMGMDEDDFSYNKPYKKRSKNQRSTFGTSKSYEYLDDEYI